MKNSTRRQAEPKGRLIMQGIVIEGYISKADDTEISQEEFDRITDRLIEHLEKDGLELFAYWKPAIKRKGGSE